MQSLVYFLFFCTLIARDSLASQETIVTIEYGSVRGIREETLDGKEFYSFLGLPYAKPPIGDLRFKNPVPAEPWDGVLSATSYPQSCLQYPFFDSMIRNQSEILPSGQEDCLYLNVYTSKPMDLNVKLPVMVFIHGGGFMTGGSQEYQPYLLLDEDIVLVVIQYRLNIFGFLSTEDAIMPGNMGLRDQQLALTWVRRNIINFGGNPEQITLFGESAGAASVHFHLLSPDSKGLFKRAILQSGTALSPWALSETHKDFARQCGEQFGCSLQDGTVSYLSCIQKIDAESLINFFWKSGTWGGSPTLMVPRVDGLVLPDRPEILLQRGRYHKVDMIMGCTKDEGALVNLMNCATASLQEDLTNNFEKFGPMSLFLNSEENAVKLANDIYQHYLGNKKIEINQETTKLYSDAYFVISHTIASLFHASDEEIGLYLYTLDHVGERSLRNLFPQCDMKNWVLHTDDLFYLFSGGPFFSQAVEKEDDLKLQKIILSAWTSFAKTGNPRPAGSDFIWEKASLKRYKQLQLIPEPKMQPIDTMESLSFWLSQNIKTIKNIVPDKRLMVQEERLRGKVNSEL